MDLHFKKIEAEDIERLSFFFSLRSNISCDSVIFDSYLWRDYYHVEFAVVDDRAVLMKMQAEGETFGGIPVCRAEDLKYYFNLLEHYFEENLGKELTIYGADEAAVTILDLDPEKYEVCELADQADYIYDAQRLRTLSGKKYHKKKNHLNAFLKAYEGRWEYRRLTKEAKPEIWKFLDRWEQSKGEEVEEHLAAEVNGLHDYLNNMEKFDAVMGGVYVDGTLEAFTIGSYNAVDKMSVVHVEKANSEIRGLYTVINQQFQLHEFPEAEFVNREDDVGLPALRKAKQSYHPVMMARKFNITRRQRGAGGYETIRE